MNNPLSLNKLSLFKNIPEPEAAEWFETLCAKPGVRIERIVSHGHADPGDDWQDQPQHEWVLLLQGQARLSVAGQADIELQPGDHVFIPAHSRHRVDWTDPMQNTIWLAVFIDQPAAPEV